MNEVGPRAERRLIRFPGLDPDPGWRNRSRRTPRGGPASPPSGEPTATRAADRLDAARATVHHVATRLGANAMIVVVAIVAVAAATAGPTYYRASQTSIARDAFARTDVVGRGYEITATGPVGGALTALQTAVEGAASIPVRQTTNSAIEATSFYPALDETLQVTWRSGVCAQLHIDGSCPAAVRQVMVSRSLASVNRWVRGQAVSFPGWGRLTITGIYTPPAAGGDYWFDRTGVYFPVEFPVTEGARTSASPFDALFTTRTTIDSGPAQAQGTAVIDSVIDWPSIRPAQVGPLDQAVSALTVSPDLSAMQAQVGSSIPSTVSSIRQGWSSLEVPTVIITAQLLGLAWLLLYLLVTDAVAARGGEIALAKLRGLPRRRVITFGLSEPTAVLVAALPVGVVLGWGASSLLTHSLLRRGTPVAFPALAWAAAVAATAGGFMAVVAGSRRTLVRPVLEQWRRAARRLADRAWVVDAVLLTAAAAGLLELTVSGQVSSARHSALSLLVPGLLGLGVAVVASRVLPIVCRLAIAARRRRGGLASYLALRHVARRPGGARATIMLATSAALASFALVAWLVDRSNYTAVANAEVGADTVLTVGLPSALPLETAVRRADRTGRIATAVEQYSSNDTITMAVDPPAWGRIARGVPASVLARLDPPSPPPLILDGDTVRVSFTTSGVVPPAMQIVLDVDPSSAPGPTPISLGVLPRAGAVTATGSLAGCPCRVRDFVVDPNPQVRADNLTGTITIVGIDVHDGSGWHRAPAGFAEPSRWTSVGQKPVATARGLSWTFNVPGFGTADLLSLNRPMPLPAVAAAAVNGGRTGRYSANGLDGRDLPVDIIARVPAVPGAPATGIVVDRADAEIAAAGSLSNVVDQVWIGPGPAGGVITRLRAQGVDVLAVQTKSGESARLGRQGPGLARVLFLAEAGAALVLAAGGAVVGLYVFARRRRYEMAALAASGLRRRTLVAALLIEQVVILAFGLLVGFATGLVAAALTLRDIPEFLVPPAAPALHYTPPIGELTLILVGGVVVVLAAVVVAGLAVVRGAGMTLLREAPP